jgi:hypothetical protein
MVAVMNKSKKHLNLLTIRHAVVSLLSGERGFGLT